MAGLHIWLVANNLFLLLCTSMYLGTGWSLVLFSFPSASKLRPDNYYNQFVPPVEAATRFFTVMTILMVIAGAVMVVWEPVNWQRVFPAIVLAGVIAATALTVIWIFPLNKQMAAGIKDQAELDSVLGRWMTLNWVRTSLWTVQWLAMAGWLGVKLT
jgi:MFS superfamily sulfate permease-like transporter